MNAKQRRKNKRMGVRSWRSVQFAVGDALKQPFANVWADPPWPTYAEYARTMYLQSQDRM